MPRLLSRSFATGLAVLHGLLQTHTLREASRRNPDTAIPCISQDLDLLTLLSLTVSLVGLVIEKALELLLVRELDLAQPAYSVSASSSNMPNGD